MEMEKIGGKRAKESFFQSKKKGMISSGSTMNTSLLKTRKFRDKVHKLGNKAKTKISKVCILLNGIYGRERL
ncbi:hypothetical protein AN958_10612 [Leucoagaricus sp. SymC.cos]|nr:hypothetical protein AN958_10612 [Leucoagaricus sp. SymC.cos]